jgi:RNA polymerase sigma factor (sigma-70 family)
MSKNASKSDEGKCRRWESICENQHERKRGRTLANRIVKNPSLAEDLLQDVCVRLLGREDADENEVKPKYFMTAMRNASFTARRKQSRSPLTNAVQIDGPVSEEADDSSVQVPHPGLNPEMETERCETNNRLLGIVRSCSEKLTDREKALFLSHLRGYTNEEIAHAWREDDKKIKKEMNAVIAKMRYRCQRENKKQGGQ